MRQSEPFRKKSYGSLVHSLFIVANRPYMLVFAHVVSSWVRKVVGIAKVHVSGCSLGDAASVALVVGVSLMSILQADDRVRVSTPPSIIFYIYY